MREILSQLEELIDELPDDRMANILKLRYGLDGNESQTLEEIAKEVGRTRERVRQIQYEALGILKDMMEKVDTGNNSSHKLS